MSAPILGSFDLAGLAWDETKSGPRVFVSLPALQLEVYWDDEIASACQRIIFESGVETEVTAEQAEVDAGVAPSLLQKLRAEVTRRAEDWRSEDLYDGKENES